MTTFRKPDAVDRMREAMAGAQVSGDCWDEIGQPLDDGVKRKVPQYVEKLKLKSDVSAEEKRQEIAELHWGKLDLESKRLTGLGAALDDIAGCVADGLEKIGEHWQGEAADAFRRSAVTLVGSLRKASVSATNAGAGLGSAIGAIRDLYGAGEPGGYREISEQVLSFRDLTQPEDLLVMDGERVDMVPTCGYLCHAEDSKYWDDNLGSSVSEYGRRTTAHKLASNAVLTTHWFRWYAYEYTEGVDHPSDIHLCINESGKQFPPIIVMINTWYGLTEGLKSSVSEVYHKVLELIRQYADSRTFADTKSGMGI